MTYYTFAYLLQFVLQQLFYSSGIDSITKLSWLSFMSKWILCTVAVHVINKDYQGLCDVAYFVWTAFLLK